MLDRLLFDSSVSHLSQVSWIYIAHAHTLTCVKQCTDTHKHADRAQLMGQTHTASVQHPFSKALSNLSSHELDWDENISSASTNPVCPDTSVYSLSSVRSSSPLTVPLSSCVSVWTERRLFCTTFALCLISVCLPLLALLFLWKHPGSVTWSHSVTWQTVVEVRGWGCVSL